MKVAAFEEARDLRNIKVGEIIESLQICQISINDRAEKKNKGITFVSNTQEERGHDDKKESMQDVKALLGEKVNNFLKNLDIKWKTDVQDMRSDIISQNKEKNEDNPKSGKGAQCFQCEGFGYIKDECITFPKNQKKGLSIFWSDFLITYFGKYEPEGESSEEDITGEELAFSYKLFLTKWGETCMKVKNEKKTISDLF